LKSVNEMVSEAMTLAHLQANIALDCIIWHKEWYATLLVSTVRSTAK
jgi:hypothetical protein